MQTNKFIIISFCLLFSFSSLFGQTDPLRTKLNTVFANINKSQIPTGYLLEYATPLLPMESFDGSLVEANRTTLNGWRMLYGTYYTSFVASPTNYLTTLATVNSTITSAQNGSTAIVIPMMHINYNTLSQMQ